MPAPPPPPYTPTPQELAALRAALDADSSILARLARSGEAGLGGGCTEWPAPVLTRWLVAEGGSVPKAAARLAEHAAWRAERLPDGWTAEKEALIAPELALGKTFASPPAPSPTTGVARPFMLSLSARHFRSARSPPQVGELSLLYAMDAVAAGASTAEAAGTGDGRVVSVVDMRGVGLANLDGPTSQAVVRLAQAAFPERLAATVLYGAPSIFGAIWSLVSRLLAPASAGKVFFLSEGGDWSKVPGVDPALVPACLGGGGGGPPPVPIQAFARGVGLGPAGAPVVGLRADVQAAVGDPLAAAAGKKVGGRGVVSVTSRAV